MAKFVPDVSTRRWVIIAQGRGKRPVENVSTPVKCPFDTGNEGVSAPEVYRLGDGKSETPGWKVRVIANKYPITDFHEVIIHNPDHQKDLDELPLEDVANVFRVYRDRYNYHAKNGQVMIFCNHGLEAGASLSHPHSQLVVVPGQINLDTLTREPVTNLVETTGFFEVFCPDFSQWPFEVWIAPKRRNTKFGQITEDELIDLTSNTQKVLQRLIKHLSDTSGHLHPGVAPITWSEGQVAYNYYIYHGNDWYLRIMPRLVHRAGFEMGTGLEVNIVDPAIVAAILKEEISE